MGEPVLPLVEPDLVGVWRKNVWWFGLRWPFSMALFSPIEKPKWLHTYPGFGIAWGFMPVLASYYIQGTRIDLMGLGLALFLGITVVEMHHMAVLTNEKEYGADLTKNVRLLLKIHRTAAYSIGLVLLLSRLI